MGNNRHNERRAFIGLLMILFPLFNASLFISSAVYIIIGYIVSSLGVSLVCLNSKKRPFTKNDIRTYSIMLVVFLLMFINNRFIATGERINMLVAQFYYLGMAAILVRFEINKRAFLKAIELLFLEHIIASAIAILVPDLYSKYILPTACNGVENCLAIGHYRGGSNPGFTTHYSTNGTILSLATIYYFVMLQKDKKPKNMLLLIISILLLLTVGKRAHPLLVAASIMSYYLFAKRDDMAKIIKRIITAVLIIILAIYGYFAVSQAIPSVTRTVDRFMAYNKSDDVSNGRSSLYNRAIDDWKQSPIVGKGWGSFSIDSNNYSNVDNMKYLEAHNDYLQMMSECGIIGLFVYLALIITIFQSTRRTIAMQEIKNDDGCYYLFGYLFLTFFGLYSFTGHPLHTTLTYALLLIVASQVKSNNMHRRRENER